MIASTNYQVEKGWELEKGNERMWEGKNKIIEDT